jgi:hypothetical protein
MRMEVKKIGSSERMQVNDSSNDVIFRMDSFENGDMDESQEEVNQDKIKDQMMEKLMNETREEINHYVGKRLALSQTDDRRCVVIAPFQRSG